MSFFANYRADRLIAEIKSSGNPGGPDGQKALDKLVAIGSSAIEPIVAALSSAEKKETLALVDALSRLIDGKSLPRVLRTMAESNGRAMSGIAWALSVPAALFLWLVPLPREYAGAFAILAAVAVPF